MRFFFLVASALVCTQAPCVLLAQTTTKASVPFVVASGDLGLTRASVVDVDTPFQVGNTALGFQFKLIQPSDTKTVDPAIADVADALRGLFSFPGYRMLDQSWVALDFGGTGIAPARTQPAYATLRLNGKGVSYSLMLTVDSVTETAVRVGVLMRQERATGGAASQIFSTTVMVSFNKTIVLGATHPIATEDMQVEVPAKPGMTAMQAMQLKSLGQKKEAETPLILVIRPERRGN